MARDDERPKRRPRMFGLDVPPPESDDDDVARIVRRSHPGHESTDPPPPERPVRPPYEPKTTPYNLTIFDPSKLPGAQLPTVEKAPASSRDAVSIRVPEKLALKIIQLIIAAITGGVIGGAFTKIDDEPAAPTKALQHVDNSAHWRDSQLKAYQTTVAEDELVKEQVRLAWMCHLNAGVSPIPGLECPELKCEQRQVTREGKIVPKQFACVFVDVKWPPIRKPQ